LQRKTTLLVEYKQLKKNNAFIDRRFGEDDESLTNDERALLRFQKQRLRELAGSKFTLATDDDENAGEDAQLTHLGRSLAEMDEEDARLDRGWDDDDDFDTRMDAQLTGDLHFGGGFVPSKTTRDISDNGGEGEEGLHGERHRKSKKEVMEEIIAKSKMHKALKSQQKEEDIVATEKLDDAWKELSQGGLLAGLLRPKGASKDELKSMTVDESDRAFDMLTKELIFEAKAQPGERTLTAEELTELERHRLEELEKQRVKRQKGESGYIGGDDLEDDFEGLGDGAGGKGSSYGLGDEEGGMPLGGYAARRAKRAQKEAGRATKKRRRGDDSDESSESEEGGSSSDEDEEEDALMTALDMRRKQRAMGDHPLQEAFRGVAAKLMVKHGLAEEENEESEEEEEEESEEASEEESGSGSDFSDEESEESEEEEAFASGSAAAGGGGGVKAHQIKKDNNQYSEEQKEENLKTMQHMSFTPALPETYAEFSSMATNLSSEDLDELLRRIRGFHATVLSTDGRKKTQVLYGCVVQHYVSMAGMVPLSLSHLDALVPHILELTPQVPFYAATLARARLQRAHQQMMQRLKDPVMRATAWPAPKTMLLLKLLTTVYPVSDKKHPVLTPASLFVCSALALCPLARPRDVASGLFLATVAVHMHFEAKRFCPEPLEFAVNLLRSCYTSTVSNTRNSKIEEEDDEEEEEEQQQKWLALTASDVSTAPSSPSEIKNLSLQKIFNASENSSHYLTSGEFKCAAAGVAIRLIGRIAESLNGVDALPEIMAPAIKVLKNVVKAAEANNGLASAIPNGLANGKHKKKKTSGTKNKYAPVAPGVAALAAEIAAKIDSAVTAIASHRRPLFNKTLAAVLEARQFNPRYEENFASGRNYDPDRDRAERKKLQRELRREERGAARELRRDSAFMAGVRDKEKATLQADLDASARRAMSFLEQQQADARSGGQGGHWKKNKRK